MNNLNETVEKLNELFKRAGVEKPEHPRLGRYVYDPASEYFPERWCWVLRDVYIRPEDTYAMFFDHYETLLRIKVFGKGYIIEWSTPDGFCSEPEWGFEVRKSRLGACKCVVQVEDDCKLTAILKAMEALQNESGGE